MSSIIETFVPTVHWERLSQQPDSVILASGSGFGDLGRHTLAACRPRAVFEIQNSKWSFRTDAPLSAPPPEVSPMEALRHVLRQTQAVGGAGIFAGGWIGFLGYDLAPLLERLPRQWPADSDWPDARLAYYDTFVVGDHWKQTWCVQSHDRFGEGPVRQREQLDRLIGELQTPDTQIPMTGPLTAMPPTSNITVPEYCQAIERILEYLRAGDIFQVNFAHRFEAELVGPMEQILIRCLRQSPAPFAAWLRRGDGAIISNSPERFLLIEPTGRIETRPIKGTRSRGANAIHDLMLRSELLCSEKDRAELTMIVDLERNDLGRICQFGSVKAVRHAEIESFRNVHHLVSTVEGRLRPGVDFVDVLGATFPGGSITGAPKIRAMQIIDELERCRRGVYTGAIGYVSDHGRADWNIAIRTMTIEGRRLRYAVGGGIVADSNPVEEHQETLTKGRAIERILSGAADADLGAKR